MKQNKWKPCIGWIFFIAAFGFFCFQIGYFFLHARYQVEYVDNRLFYVINALCIGFLTFALLLLLTRSKKWNLIIVGAAAVFIFIHMISLIQTNQQVKNITSISPDFQHVFAVKKDMDSGNGVFYRSHFDILGRQKERLPDEIGNTYTVKWLANDVAVFTYKGKNNHIQQFVGTYGDRGSGVSYYEVGPVIQGKWNKGNVQVISNKDGITVVENNATELFGWDQVKQFGTLAVVLMCGNEAEWTISLNEDFKVRPETLDAPTGTISLYKATLKKQKPIVLHYINGQD